MGQSKGGGYEKLDVNTPEVSEFLKQILGQSSQNMQSASQAYQQFLPGGGGGKAIADAAQNRFQQQTIPSIMNAFGSGAKSSSALNQALAAGASNLNTDIAEQLARLQLGAAQGQAGIGAQQANLGTTPQFAYAPKPLPFWQQMLLAGTQAGGEAARGWLSRPVA